jgi:hypothetical protein
MPRSTSSTSLEWMGQPYELNVNALNRRWAREENIDSWGQMVIKHTDDDIRTRDRSPAQRHLAHAPDGSIYFWRMDTHRRYVENENEAFFLRITRVGDWLYEGADMGILVMRGRMMTDDFQLLERSTQMAPRHQGPSHQRTAPGDQRKVPACTGDRWIQNDVNGKG